MLTSPHLIDGVRRKLLHVKSVEDDRGIRQTLRDGLLVRGGHIDRHRFNAFALLLADEVEEGVQGLGGLPRVVIEHDRQVAMTLALGEFIPCREYLLPT